MAVISYPRSGGISFVRFFGKVLRDIVRFPTFLCSYTAIIVPSMPFGFLFRETSEEDGALVLPYRPQFDGARTNRGFIDLRGKPEEARLIAEAAPSMVFQELLARLAQADSRFFTIGCEMGCHPIATPDGGTEFSAGAYLQIAASDLHSPAALFDGEQKKLADQLRQHVQQVAGGHHWRIEFIVSVVCVSELGGPDQIWSPVINMDAIADTPEAASLSAERLFEVVGDFLS